MAEDKANEQADGETKAGAPSGERRIAASLWWVRQGNGWRVAALMLGGAAVIGGFVLWLAPTSHTGTTAAENTTTVVIDSTGHKSTTVVKRITTTAMPGLGRSDAMLVAILTFGVGLLVVAGLWNRIQEFAIGGVSIKLTEAAVAPPGIALVDAVADQVDLLDTATADKLATKVDAMSKRGLRLARVDLQSGDKWAPTNLSLFVLLLARRSKVEVVVFSGQGDAGPKTYFGAASVAWLADRFAAEDPTLAAAYRAVETMPLVGPPGDSLGGKFYLEMTQRDPGRAGQTDRVNPRRLDELATPALIHDRVETKGEQTLSKQQQRAILVFPLSYVPITDRGRLDGIVDKRRLAEKIALSAVGL
jgi:hypothetical protein